jgi:hypothetical protein
MTEVAIGLRAQKGGAVAVAVSPAGPSLILSTLLTTAAEGDRLSLEPYGIAAGMTPDEAAAAVAEGRRRQDDRAAQGLRDIIRGLAERGFQPVRAALLVNRAGWVTDLLGYSREWPEHVPVAEGLAVREALRFGIRRCGMEISELDEKSLPDQAARQLGRSPDDLDAQLKMMGQTAGRPWRKEQKLACLAAWMAAAG